MTAELTIVIISAVGQEGRRWDVNGCRRSFGRSIECCERDIELVRLEVLYNKVGYSNEDHHPVSQSVSWLGGYISSI